LAKQERQVDSHLLTRYRGDLFLATHARTITSDVQQRQQRIRASGGDCSIRP
jgi:hypothetical protein